MIGCSTGSRDASKFAKCVGDKKEVKK